MYKINITNHQKDFYLLNTFRINVGVNSGSFTVNWNGHGLQIRAIGIVLNKVGMGKDYKSALSGSGTNHAFG